MPISPAALERHLKASHSHFGEGDLFLDNGDRATGFFITKTPSADEDRVPESIRYFRSPDQYALGTRITDRKRGVAWQVKNVEGEEAAWLHTMETTAVA